MNVLYENKEDEYCTCQFDEHLRKMRMDINTVPTKLSTVMLFDDVVVENKLFLHDRNTFFFFFYLSYVILVWNHVRKLTL